MNRCQNTTAARIYVTMPQWLQKTPLLLLAATMMLTGCAHHYVMRLTDGVQITTASKPKLKDGVYYFKDAKGEQHAVGEARVREIAPASMVDDTRKQKPIKSNPQKKRHWYYLWLA